LAPLVLSEDERHTLENWARRRRTAQGLALRARIVLACAQGGNNIAVAARLGVNRSTSPNELGPRREVIAPSLVRLPPLN